MFFLLLCGWKDKFVSYIQKINSDIYCSWRCDSIFWVKHWVFWIPKLCTSNVLKHQSPMGELFYYQWPGFHQVIWEGLQICFINFSGLQQDVFPIFKLLNSTEADYGNQESYDWKSSILQFPGMTTEKMAACREQSTHVISYIMW